MFYNVRNWYWVVADDGSNVYSTATRAYVPVSDEAYVAWLAAGGWPTHIDSEASLQGVLAQQYPEGWYANPRYVPVYLARERLEAGGLWVAAAAAIASDPAVMLKVTTLQNGLDVADPVVLGLLVAIGADPAVILA